MQQHRAKVETNVGKTALVGRRRKGQYVNASAEASTRSAFRFDEAGVCLEMDVALLLHRTRVQPRNTIARFRYLARQRPACPWGCVPGSHWEGTAAAVPSQDVQNTGTQSTSRPGRHGDSYSASLISPTCATPRQRNGPRLGLQHSKTGQADVKGSTAHGQPLTCGCVSGYHAFCILYSILGTNIP